MKMNSQNYVVPVTAMLGSLFDTVSRWHPLIPMMSLTQPDDFTMLHMDAVVQETDFLDVCQE